MDAKLEKVINEYFGDDRIKYFHGSDSLKEIEGDSYLKYSPRGDKVELWIGGDNGEVCMIVTDKASIVNNIIRDLLYSEE